MPLTSRAGLGKENQVQEIVTQYDEKIKNLECRFFRNNNGKYKKVFFKIRFKKKRKKVSY